MSQQLCQTVLHFKSRSESVKVPTMLQLLENHSFHVTEDHIGHKIKHIFKDRINVICIVYMWQHKG